LDVAVKNKEDTSSDVEALRTVGDGILTGKYETKFSSFSWPNPDEIKDRQAWVDQKWAALGTLAATKRTALEADLANELEKERLRLGYATQSGTALRWAKDTVEAVAATPFAVLLSGLEAQEAHLKRSDTDTRAKADSLRADLTKSAEEMKQRGVTENKYTTNTIEAVGAAMDDVSGALAARQSTYAANLTKARENDALCKKLAEVAAPLQPSCRLTKIGSATAKKNWNRN